MAVVSFRISLPLAVVVTMSMAIVPVSVSMAEINVQDDVIQKIKNVITEEAGKIELDVEKLKAGSKFLQSLFFGVAACLSSAVFLLSLLLCCRARREERVQGYVDSTRA